MLAKRFIDVDKSVVSTAKNVQKGTKTIGDLDNSINSASSSSAEFAAKLKSITANIGIMLAINLAIKAIQTAWDAWNETVEESQAKVDNINSKLEDLNTELSELKNLQDKDEYDHLRIQQLETEIALQKQLLEIERKRLYQNQIGTSFSDYFDGDSLVSKKTQEENRYNKEGYEYLSDQYDKNEAELRKANEKIAALNNSLSVAESEAERLDILESLNDATEKRNKLLEEQIEVADQLTVNSADYLNNYQLAQEAIESELLTGSDLAKAKEMAEYWSQMYFNSLGMITNIQKRNGTYDSSGMIKDILAKADFQDASKQLEELGKSGELSIATLASRFPELIEYLDKAGISAQELYQYIMALSNPDAINYDNVRKQLMQSLGFGDTIDSANEAQLWNEISSLGEEELVLEAYLKVRDQYGEHPEGWNAKDWISHIRSELETELIEIDTQLSISETIDQLNTRLKPAFDSLKSAYQDIFTEDGFTLENVGVDMLNSIKSTIDELNSMEGVDINIDSSAFEEFARVLSNTSSTAEDVQNQFNQLSNTIVRATSCTEVNSETFDVLTKSLEEMGLVNAREVLEEIIQAQEEFQAVSEQLGLTLEEVANATYEETVQMLIEAQAAGQDTQALWQLAVAQGTITDGTIATESNVDALLAEAQAAGLDAAMLTALENVRNGNIKDTNAAQAILEQTRQELQASMSSFKLDFDFSPAVKSAGKAGSKAGDAYVDAFEKELKQLQTLRDQGKITEKEYLDYLRKLYQKFFKDKKKYAEQYAKYEHEYLQGMKSLYESALSGITSMLDKQISAYGDAKNAAVEALEAERDAAIEAKEAEKERLEEKIDLIDKEISQKEKEIDGINDEIDAIREANDERQRQLDLQKAQYELERMQNQKTILQYSSDKGMHYVTDTSGVRDAKDAVDNAETEIEITNKEKEIKLIEKEIELLEERKNAINEQIDFLDKQIDQINKRYDKLIADTEKYWDNLIKGMEDYKSRWEELAEIEEQAKIIETLRSLGIETGDILNMSEEAFAKFKDEYISILADIYSGNDSMLSALSDTTGQSVEQMGSYLNATQGYIDSLSGIGESLNPVAEAIGNVDENMSSLSSTASDANTNISETATNVGNVATNVGAVVDELNQLPESGKVSGLAGEFETLAKKIEAVAKALGIGEGDTVGTLFQAMSNLNTVTLGGETEGIIGQFVLLKNAIIDVIDTIGSSEEQTVGSLMAAITQLNSIVLDENIIAQFNNLKTAIDSVSSAISGGGESSGNEGQSGNSGSGKGGESGGKSSAGEGGGNSLTGAITEMGETANKIIGEPDAEGDGTVIGEFGAMETAVNDVTAAIGGGDSESGKGQDKGDSDSDNLIGSITNLGETTEETLGEPDGEGVTGRFGQFRDVVADANEQVTGIADGLTAIDGQTVECTIKINIDSDGIPAYAAGTALGAMNLESAEYNAKYEGNAHVSGTANVTGNWGVRKPGKSLVGELGQELWVHSADGTFETVGDNGPEWINTAKGDLIFNHLQTKELLDKGNIVKTGKAYANGTVQYSDGTTILPDGSTLRPLQPGDKMYDLQQKFEAYFKSIDGNLEKLVPNSYYEHQRQMEDMAKQITNISNISNSNKPSVSIGDIHVTCPGVTSQQVAEQLGNVIGKELDKQFNGFSNWTDQMSRRR